MTAKRYAMVIDQKRCIGCHSCAVACKSENNMPANYSLNVVLTENSNIVDNPVGAISLGDTCTMDHFNRVTGTPRNDDLTRACQHCFNAPCVKGCPSGATTQRDDGIVVVDPARCLGNGCEICMKECTYGYGTMRVLIENPIFNPGFDLGNPNAVPSTNNTVKKCTFCAHRLDKGEQPFCVSQCPARARYFGDINNSGSEVSLLLKKREHKTIPVEVGKTGTEPFVYFLKP